GGGHFLHRRGDLVGAAELLAGTGRHQAGDRVQRAAGAVQVAGTAPQPVE
ncbi:hypothetical protein IH689_24105, partial [Escherichia coli]|nr:hypothetical protein [Escherichia coli]